jgi:hypothetical protein
MLRSVNLLIGTHLSALDGEAGVVEECLHDDEKWVIRYLRLRTGDWLLGKTVLVSTMVVPAPRDGGDWRVRMTREEIGRIPEAAAGQPITRDWEYRHFRFFAWPLYWSGGNFWGGGAYPGMLPAAPVPVDTPDLGEGLQEDAEAETQRVNESHLHAAGELRGHTVLAPDGDVGEVDDILFDDATWAITYLAVSTGGWLGNKKVLVPVDDFELDTWADGKVNVSVTRSAIENAPEWQPLEPITAEYEQLLQEHYGEPRHRRVAA